MKGVVEHLALRSHRYLGEIRPQKVQVLAREKVQVHGLCRDISGRTF